MADFPALPVFTDAYMRDCWHLTDAEHGRYFMLMFLIWQTPNCRIPNEPEWIARKLRKTHAEFDAEIAPIIKEFCEVDGNWIIQKRLKREYDYLKRTSKSQSDRAKSRWNKEKSKSRNAADEHPAARAGHPPASDPAMPPHPTHTHTLKEETRHDADASSNGKLFDLDDVSPTSIEHPRFAEFWEAYPKRDGSRDRKGAVKAFKRALKSTDPDTIIAGAAAYAADVRARGKENTEFVAQARTWLNGDRWTEQQNGKQNGQAGHLTAERRRELEEYLYGDQRDREAST